MSVVVITGASSGIGRALAVRAARAGYDVVAIGRNEPALAALAAQVGSEYGRIVTAAIDIADPANAARTVALAKERFGRLDVLVNNAGSVAVGPLAAQSDDALRLQFGTHVIGPLALVREALPLLRASQGQVFLVGSGVARAPVHGLGAYSPSKAAVRSAATILRRELKPEGIAVTYVDPGVVDTPFMTRAGMAGAPPSLLVSPQEVARRILLAIHTRPRVVNAVPWQTAFVALAEAFPALTDAILERNPALVGIDAAPQLPAVTVALPPENVTPAPEPKLLPKGSSFDDTLAPLRRRMERLKLDRAFVRSLLVAGALLDPSDVALRWAGMPNKNERALTNDVLDALAGSGFLVPEGDGFRVVREPEPLPR
jgi:short-subunit dehydrogenase